MSRDRQKLVAAPPVNIVRGEDVDVTVAEAEAFLTSLGDHREPVVLSMCGPISTLLGSAAFQASPNPLDDVVDVVGLVANRLLDSANELLPHARILLFFDEPGLANSMHPTYPVESDALYRVISQAVESVSHKATVGITVPSRVDWNRLFGTGIEALRVPLTAGLQYGAHELALFLERGGVVAWGVVPTNEPLGGSPERLWNRLVAVWTELAELGVDPMLLRESSIITATSSLENFGVAQAQLVSNLVGSVSKRVMNQIIGARLMIGA